LILEYNIKLYLSNYPLLENPPLKKVEPKFCSLLKKERGGAKVLFSFSKRDRGFTGAKPPCGAKSLFPK